MHCINSTCSAPSIVVWNGSTIDRRFGLGGCQVEEGPNCLLLPPTIPEASRSCYRYWITMLLVGTRWWWRGGSIGSSSGVGMAMMDCCEIANNNSECRPGCSKGTLFLSTRWYSICLLCFSTMLVVCLGLWSRELLHCRWACSEFWFWMVCTLFSLPRAFDRGSRRYSCQANTPSLELSSWAKFRLCRLVGGVWGVARGVDGCRRRRRL